ncbi:MAG TPA: Hsp20/alpha crystallin family protein [Bacteroidota bacterium]|nr:Hsp20/alpha crystallin family protein [Bacteroidota bacterium]
MLLKVDFDEPISELVRGYFSDEFLPSASSQPAIDVTENENESIIVAELPGVKKEDISLTVEDGWLALKGERKSSTPSDVTKVLHREIAHQPFSRSIKLPHEVNVREITAALENGILKITLPKAETVRPRSIEIK